MKSLTVLLLLLLGFAGIAYPAEPARSDVSAEDAAAVQKSVKELGLMFGVEAPKEASKTAVPAPAKTVADVMDKTVDKLSEVVGAISESLKKVAPEVWRIMIKQQYAKATFNVIVPSVFGVVLVILWLRLRSLRAGMRKSEPDIRNTFGDGFSDYGWVAVAMWIVGVVFAIDVVWFANRVADSSLLLINPEFYAIQDLLRMILNKGT